MAEYRIIIVWIRLYAERLYDYCIDNLEYNDLTIPAEMPVLLFLF